MSIAVSGSLSTFQSFSLIIGDSFIILPPQRFIVKSFFIIISIHFALVFRFSRVLSLPPSRIIVKHHFDLFRLVYSSRCRPFNLRRNLSLPPLLASCQPDFGIQFSETSLQCCLSGIAWWWNVSLTPIRAKSQQAEGWYILQ
jgi:hypothetical protein